MSKIPPQAKNGRDRAFGVACWTLGGMAFVLLLMVGVSFSLSGRTVVVEKVVQVPVPQPVVAAPPPAPAGTGMTWPKKVLPRFPTLRILR